MFFMREMTKEMSLPPAFLNARINEIIRSRVLAENEGRCHGPEGNILKFNLCPYLFVSESIFLYPKSTNILS